MEFKVFYPDGSFPTEGEISDLVQFSTIERMYLCKFEAQGLPFSEVVALAQMRLAYLRERIVTAPTSVQSIVSF